MKRNKKHKNKGKKSGKFSENISETNKQNISSIERENPEFNENQKQSSDIIQDETSVNASADVAADVSGDISGDVSANVSAEVSEDDASNDVSDDISEKTSTDVSAEVSEDDASNDVPDDISEKISADVSAEVSEDISADVSEDASAMLPGIDFLEPDEYHKSKGTTKFVDPDDMLKRHLKISDTPSPDHPEEFGTKQLKPDWFLSPDELSGEKKAPEVVKEYSTERIAAVSPTSLKEEPQDEDEYDFSDGISDDLSEDQIKTEALSKDDILDPFDLISPDEFLAEETHFVSRALKSGTVILGKYKITKKITEKRDHTSYLVKDIIEDGRKYILHEIIPPEMDQEELRKRRYKFGDNVRLLMTFKHEYLGTVYEYFTENQREYYVMEYVDGLSFSRLSKMNVKAFSEKEVRKWGADLCNVLTFLHDRPTPFTLGEFDPDDIMIDQNGNIKIITYNLHRFFDVERTLEFMPNNPRDLHDEITMLSRFLYYLLTKDEYVDDDMKPPEYPENTSPKMIKLLNLCCKTGQQSIGYIGTFEKKLEDTAVPESPDSFYDMLKHGRWGANRGISIIGRLTGGFLGQNPFLIALEIILVVFLLMMGTFQKIEQKKGFVNPQGVPLLYVAGGSSLLTYRQDNLKLLEDTDLGGIISDLAFTNISFSEYKNYKTVSITANALIAGIKGSSSLRFYDAKNHSLLTTILVDKDPGKMEIDNNSRILLVIHKIPSTISVIDLKTLKLKRLLLTGLNPSDMTILKQIKVSEEQIKLKLRDFELQEKAKQKAISDRIESNKLNSYKIHEVEKPEDSDSNEDKDKKTESDKKSAGEEKGENTESYIEGVSPDTVNETNTPAINTAFPVEEKPTDTPTPESDNQKILKTDKWYELKNRVVAVTDEGSKDVIIMDTENGTILSRILIDGVPSSVIQSVEGDKLYVLDKKSGKIIVIDILINRILDEIPISLSNTVTSMALDRKRNRLWLSLSKEDSIAYYDLESGKFSDTYAIIGNNPTKLYMDEKHDILWITNERTMDLVKFDCKRDKVLERIDVHKDINAIYIEDTNSGQTTGTK